MNYVLCTTYYVRCTMYSDWCHSALSCSLSPLPPCLSCITIPVVSMHAQLLSALTYSNPRLQMAMNHLRLHMAGFKPVPQQSGAWPAAKPGYIIASSRQSYKKITLHFLICLQPKESATDGSYLHRLCRQCQRHTIHPSCAEALLLNSITCVFENSRKSGHANSCILQIGTGSTRDQH